MTDKDGNFTVLQSKLNQLKATQASLQADLIRLKEVPNARQVKRAAQHGRKDLSLSIQQLNQQVAEIEEKCVLYRTAGWTVFEMDLDIGRRGREMRRQAGTTNSEKEALGLGIRLETYYKGRFYQPYYLIFAKPQQEIVNVAKILDTRMEDARKMEATTTSNLRLLRHTLPHFVPLSDMMQSYLRPSLNTQSTTTEKTGGLELLDDLMQRDGISLFLSQLHTHLQSLVSRRQQALALSDVRLPGSNPSYLRAFSNDSFGQLSIRWDLPIPSSQDLEAFEQSEGVLYPNNDGSEADMTVGDSKTEGEMNAALEISIVYHDLSSDRIGRPAKEVSSRRQMVEALGNTESPGLKCTFATVFIETIRSKVPVARRGASENFEKLQIHRKRRTDWESIFAQPSKSLPELDEALHVVTSLAWKEEMQRVAMMKQ